MTNYNDIKERELPLSSGGTLSIGYADSEIYLNNDPEDSSVWVGVENSAIEYDHTDITLKLFGLTIDDVEIQWKGDTWDDPGYYPSGAGGGRLSSYSYAYVESAKLDKSFDKDNIEYKIEFNRRPPDNWQGWKTDYINKEKACSILKITSEEFDKAIDEAKEITLEVYRKYVNDPGNFEDLTRD